MTGASNDDEESPHSNGLRWKLVNAAQVAVGLAPAVPTNLSR